MLILKDMVHILTSWCKYNSSNWQAFEKLLSPKEIHLLEIIRSDNFDVHSQKQIPSRYKKSLTSKLSKELAFYPGKLPDITDYQTNVLECNNLLYSIKLVSTLSIRHTPLDAAMRLVVLSRTFDLTNHRMAVLKHLCTHYASVDRNKYRVFKNESMQVIDIVKAEDTALFYYNELIVKKKDTKLEQLATYESTLESLTILDGYITSGAVSIQFYVWYYQIKIISCRLIGDHKQALFYAKEGYRYFDNLPFRHIQSLQHFLTLLAECYLQIKLLDHAKQSIMSLLEIGAIKGSPEWISSKRLVVRLELAYGNYDEAYLAYKSLTSNKLYQSYPSDFKIPERIQEQYFNILLLVGCISKENKPSRIAINRFLKIDADIDYKKKEIRIPIVIAQLLYNIYYKEYDSMMSRLEVLRDYCARRLSPKSPYQRSNLFIRMLLVIPSSHFNAIAAKRNAKNYYNRMTRTTYDITSHDTLVEIIPYEHLWDLILNHLKKPRANAQLHS